MLEAAKQTVAATATTTISSSQTTDAATTNAAEESILQEESQRSEATTMSSVSEATAEVASNTDQSGAGATNTTKRRKRKRPIHGLVSFEDMARRVSKKWHETSDAVKEHYQALAEADRCRYDQEKIAYLKRKHLVGDRGGESLVEEEEEEKQRQPLENDEDGEKKVDPEPYKSTENAIVEQPRSVSCTDGP